jgi:hypothetical protein
MASTVIDYDAIYQRDHYTGAYCGFDGRSFDNWMQLLCDHIKPTGQGGTTSEDNLVTACYYCNALCSGFKFATAEPLLEILKKRRKHVTAKQREIYQRWLRSVPNYYKNHAFPAQRPWGRK